METAFTGYILQDLSSIHWVHLARFKRILYFSCEPQNKTLLFLILFDSRLFSSLRVTKSSTIWLIWFFYSIVKLQKGKSVLMLFSATMSYMSNVFSHFWHFGLAAFLSRIATILTSLCSAVATVAWGKASI